MKISYMTSCLAALCLLAGCQNAATVFANRSVLHISTPELIGERASVTGSPTSANSNVQADKEYDLDTKANISGTGTVNDTSTNQQETPAQKLEN